MPAVFHFERLKGCRPEIIAFFNWWSKHGPYPLTIGQDGGLRKDEAKQLAFFNSHKSKARTLADTPHGRGAAADAYKAILNPEGTKVVAVKLDRKSFEQYGALAEKRGFTWGGRFTSFDGPHIQMKEWKMLPYPPSTAN